MKWSAFLSSEFRSLIGKFFSITHFNRLSRDNIWSTPTYSMCVLPLEPPPQPGVFRLEMMNGEPRRLGGEVKVVCWAGEAWNTVTCVLEFLALWIVSGRRETRVKQEDIGLGAHRVWCPPTRGRPGDREQYAVLRFSWSDPRRKWGALCWAQGPGTVSEGSHVERLDFGSPQFTPHDWWAPRLPVNLLLRDVITLLPRVDSKLLVDEIYSQYPKISVLCSVAFPKIYLSVDISYSIIFFV